jgi:hypothetical protein
MKLEFEYPIEYLKMGFGIRLHFKDFYHKNRVVALARLAKISCLIYHFMMEMV